MDDLIRGIVVNYLHYVKELDVEAAEELYQKNILHFNKVFNIIGDNVMINILKEINKHE